MWEITLVAAGCRATELSRRLEWPCRESRGDKTMPEPAKIQRGWGIGDGVSRLPSRRGHRQGNIGGFPAAGPVCLDHFIHRSHFPVRPRPLIGSRRRRSEGAYRSTRGPQSEGASDHSSPHRLAAALGFRFGVSLPCSTAVQRPERRGAAWTAGPHPNPRPFDNPVGPRFAGSMTPYRPQGPFHLN